MKTLIIALILLPSVCLAQMTEYERQSLELQRQANLNQIIEQSQQQRQYDEAIRLQREQMRRDDYARTLWNMQHNGNRYNQGWGNSPINRQAQAMAFDQMTNQPPIVNLYDDIAKQRAYDQMRR